MKIGILKESNQAIVSISSDIAQINPFGAKVPIVEIARDWLISLSLPKHFSWIVPLSKRFQNLSPSPSDLTQAIIQIKNSILLKAI